jgi:hypothetical protein
MEMPQMPQLNLTTPTPQGPDSVTVCFGVQKFNPGNYQSLELGPFYMKTDVKPGESVEEALERAYSALEGFARKVWARTLKDFQERAQSLQ